MPEGVVGYVLKGFENELGREMPVPPASNGIPVDVLSGDQDEEVWLRVTTEGFSVPDSTGSLPVLGCSVYLETASSANFAARSQIPTSFWRDVKSFALAMLPA